MILWHTLAHRWYAFAFVPAMFLVARDRRAALRFWAIASIVSFAAEYSSTHNGFPYGRYAYVPLPHEAHVANVPLFVPLTFGVVVWAGRALADARTKLGAIAGGALCATAIDVVIDPVTLRGGSWFLGPLYRYARGGIWFGVPWSNYAGWLLVSAIILALDNRVEPRNARGKLLAIGICVFFVAVGFTIGHERIPLSGLAVTVVLAAIAFGKRRRTSFARALRGRRGIRRSPS